MTTQTIPFTATHTENMPALLAQLYCSLAISTFQAGKVILVGSDGEHLNHLPRTFRRPMGLAVDGNHLAVACEEEVVLLHNDPRLARTYPRKVDFYDALFIPRSTHYCGELDVHDLAWGNEGLIGVNTLFSCLFRLDPDFNFVPLWQPPFIRGLEAEDRCHLNGMAVVDGAPKYATALGTTDTPEGWRDDKLEGGVLLDISSGEVVLSGLPMPHSPRVVDGELYILLGATGELAVVDVEEGSYEVLQPVPGFARGMAHWGEYLFVGFSKIREGRLFEGVRLDAEETHCGMGVVHRLSGGYMGEIRYVNTCEEIYDVQVLPGMRRPGILGVEGEMHKRAVSIPQTTYWAVEEEEQSGESDD